jgi:signal transduction histidine kinase
MTVLSHNQPAPPWVDEPPDLESVERRLADDFVAGTKWALFANIGVWLILLVILQPHVESHVLGSWAVAFAALMAIQCYLIQQFRTMASEPNEPDIGERAERFLQKRAWIWCAAAIGLAAPVFFNPSALFTPIGYFCGGLIAVAGAFSALRMASHPSSLRAYVHGLSLCLLLGVLYALSSQTGEHSWREALAMLLLLFALQSALLYGAGQIYQSKAAQYAAQHGNASLVESLQRQTETARQAMHTKNSLLASATHDLRQPVHALAFYADWLRNEPQMADTIVPKILIATDSVNTLFNSLFDFAKIESGTISVDLQEVSIAQLMEDLTIQYNPMAQAKGLAFRTVSVDAFVRSDPVLLRRVIANLLGNAFRYTESGEVVLSARLLDRYVWLDVIDSGPGISEEHLPHVFKEFYRAQQHHGTVDSFGLGLAIVQKLCQALGHTVEIRSIVGQGTACRVEMQRDDALAHATDRKTEP